MLFTIEVKTFFDNRSIFNNLLLPTKVLVGDPRLPAIPLLLALPFNGHLFYGYGPAARKLLPCYLSLYVILYVFVRANSFNK